MKFFKWISIGAVGLYLTALLFVFFTQRSFIYFPPEEPIPDWFLSEHDEQILPISIEGVGNIKSIYQPPPNDKAPIILFLHGNGSTAYQYTDHFEAFQNWGMGYLAVEYPGYAANPGTPNERDILRTALANYDMLIADGITPERIVIYGDSLGAAAAVHVASQRDAAGLILSAPFLSMQAMAHKQMPWFPTSILLKDTYRSDLKMPSITEPLLLVHGDADELIPHSQGEALYARHKGDPALGEKRFILIKGGHHNLWNTEMPMHIKAAVERFVQ